MSFMRMSSTSNWEDCPPVYAYMSLHKGDAGRLTGLDGATPQQLIEVVMRLLEQSDELDEETLEECHRALRVRLWLEEDSAGRTEIDIDDSQEGDA